MMSLSKLLNTSDDGWCIVNKTEHPALAIFFNTLINCIAEKESSPEVGSNDIGKSEAVYEFISYEHKFHKYQNVKMSYHLRRPKKALLPTLHQH